MYSPHNLILDSQSIELQEQIGQLESHAIIGGERKDAVEHLQARIARLSDDVADLTGFVPPYDQRIYSQVSYHMFLKS